MEVLFLALWALCGATAVGISTSCGVFGSVDRVHDALLGALILALGPVALAVMAIAR